MHKEDHIHAAQDKAQALAEAAAASMLARDNATAAMGIALAEVGPGHARMTMTVRADMLNGHQTCHGGLISALADSAFAFACNSYNELTVASGFSIDFVAPARQGDLLTARCAEVARAGRTGVYDTTVTNQHGEPIAVFRGRAHTIKGRPAVATPPSPQEIG